MITLKILTLILKTLTLKTLILQLQEQQRFGNWKGNNTLKWF